MGAGFLGGIVGGLLAGYVAHLIGTWQVPRWLRGLMPVVIIPLLASIVASGLMFLVLGGPIAGLTVGPEQLAHRHDRRSARSSSASSLAS